MAEESKHDKYIICSKCKSKYIKDEEHISNDFGYTRLEDRYKTCVRCRVRGKVNGKTYYNKHIEEIKEYSKKYREEHLEESKQYRENNIDRLREYDRARSKVKTGCEICGKEVGKQYLSKHQENANCQLVAIIKKTKQLINKNVS